MQEINGRQFPTEWKDLFLEFKDDSVYSDVSISIKDIPIWLDEYHHIPDNVSVDALDDLLHRGNQLASYLVTVKWKIHHMFSTYELAFDVWRSATMGSYSGGGVAKDPSEAARERMVMVEPEYEMRRNVLARLETMEGWSTDMTKALWQATSQLGYTISNKLKEQPRFPI